MSLTPEQRRTLQTEHDALAKAAKERRSVDLFARAGFEGLAWGILGGVCGKLMWDSLRPPLFLFPLLLLELLLLSDAVRNWRLARASLAREVTILARLREVRAHLGIDPPAALPSRPLAAQPEARP